MAVKKVSQGSVSIGVSLQKLFVVAAGLLLALQTSMGMYFFASVQGPKGVAFWLYQGSVVLVPLAFFGLALWYVGKFGSVLNRMFKAAFIAFIGVLVLTVALQLGTMYPVVVASDYNNDTWQYYPFYLGGAVAVAYVLILVGLKTKRIKRG